MNYRLPPIETAWDAENSFYLQAPQSRMAKLLSHYELYKEITGLPGAIVECGVYKGASLMRFAQFRTYLENDDSRRIFGFDAFGEFPRSNVASENDKKFIERFETAGGHGISKGELEHCFKKKGIRNVVLHQGDVFDIVPKFTSDNPQLKIALLHLDLDVYEPTKYCVDQFLTHMVRGGVIIFDDYGAVEGATQAADELLKEHNLSISKLPFYNVPSFVRV